MLKPNDKVRIKFQEEGKRKGIILKKLQPRRLYLVKTEQGLIIKRNRRYLLKTQEKINNPVTNTIIKIYSITHKKMNIPTLTNNTTKILAEVVG